MVGSVTLSSALRRQNAPRRKDHARSQWLGAASTAEPDEQWALALLCQHACMASGRVGELKVLLNELAERAEFDGEPPAEDQILRREAIGGFVAGSAQLLDEASSVVVP
jgi:hypothetical protein